MLEKAFKLFLISEKVLKELLAEMLWKKVDQMHRNIFRRIKHKCNGITHAMHMSGGECRTDLWPGVRSMILCVCGSKVLMPCTPKNLHMIGGGCVKQDQRSNLVASKKRGLFMFYLPSSFAMAG